MNRRFVGIGGFRQGTRGSDVAGDGGDPPIIGEDQVVAGNEEDDIVVGDEEDAVVVGS